MDQDHHAAERRVVFIDTETTGLGMNAEPWEIALIVRDAGFDNDQVHHWMLPVDAAAADPKALTISGYHQRHPTESGHPGELADPATTASKVAQITHGALIVGVNPAYDMRVLEVFLGKHGLTPSWDYRPYPIEAIAAGWLLATAQHQGLTGPHARWNSHKLSRACGVEVPADESRHTAVGDAQWARAWFDHLHGQATTTPVNAAS